MPDSLAGAGSFPDARVAARPLVGVVLAAGAGLRLRPLTTLRPKALCPVGGVALLDLALLRVRPCVDEVAVNLHHDRARIEAHLASRPGAGTVHRSIEEPDALGTAGALGALRPWIDGRGVLVHNCDVWAPVDLGPFVAGWDGERPRVLIAPPDRSADPEPVEFGPGVGLVATLLPWSHVAGLAAVPSGLYETTLGRASADGRLDTVGWTGPFIDCGTPRDYLDANLAAADAAGGSIVGEGVSGSGTIEASVVGAGAVVAGSIRRCVLWDGAVVRAGESLTEVIRAPGLTDDVSPPG